MASQKTIIAFDLYGTLLSTESIAKELARFFGEDKSKSVAALWRRYQLEYTWRITSMGLYRTFSEITRGALKHAVGELGLSLAQDDVDELMKSYDSLHVFPEVSGALKSLENNAAVDSYVFSNGTDKMVSASIETSPDLSPHRSLFKALITVEEVGAFKPAMSVYGDLVNKVGSAGSAGNVWVVSANPFDVVGARAAGLQSAWIDRAGTGWVDRLGEVIGEIQPTIVVGGVDKAVAEILKQSSA